MVRVPTIAEEDAKRPNRERECLVAERTRIVNRGYERIRNCGETDSKARSPVAQPRKRESAGLKDDQRPPAACRHTIAVAVKLMTRRSRNHRGARPPA
jgi:hypothetical protein